MRMVQTSVSVGIIRVPLHILHRANSDAATNGVYLASSTDLSGVVRFP